MQSMNLPDTNKLMKQPIEVFIFRQESFENCILF